MEAAIKDLQNTNGTNIWYPEYTYINPSYSNYFSVSILANATTKICRITIKVNKRFNLGYNDEDGTLSSLFTVAGACLPVWPKAPFGKPPVFSIIIGRADGILENTSMHIDEIKITKDGKVYADSSAHNTAPGYNYILYTGEYICTYEYLH